MALCYERRALWLCVMRGGLCDCVRRALSVYLN